MRRLTAIAFSAMYLSCSAGFADAVAVQEVMGAIKGDVPEGWSVEIDRDGTASIIILKRGSVLIDSEYRLLPVPSIFHGYGNGPITLTIRMYERPFVSQQEWEMIRSEGIKAEEKIVSVLQKLAEVPVVHEGKPVEPVYRKYKPRTSSETDLVIELRKLVQQRDQSRRLPQYRYNGTSLSLFVTALDATGAQLPVGTAIVLKSEALQAELDSVRSIVTGRLEQYKTTR